MPQRGSRHPDHDHHRDRRQSPTRLPRSTRRSHLLPQTRLRTNRVTRPVSNADVLRLSEVRLVRGNTTVLDGVDWRVRRGERWIVLGPNGSGKSSLCQIITLYLHPSSGSVWVLGGRLGRVDTRTLRLKIGVTSAAIAEMIRPNLTAEEIVVAGKYAALAHWWHTYEEIDWEQARACLKRVGCRDNSEQRFGTLSSGERQRVLVARALMTNPDLLVLAEPTTGLDLAGREQLVQTLTELARDSDAPPLIVVTHHVDEVPPGFTHALLLANGRVSASGPIQDVLTSTELTNCFGLKLAVERRHDRWRARATNPVNPL